MCYKRKWIISNILLHVAGEWMVTKNEDKRFFTSAPIKFTDGKYYYMYMHM